MNRLKYIGSQITIGGLKEFTYPASRELGSPKDTGETLLQITGGLLTPSPIDLLATVTVRKLNLSTKGRKLLNKVINRLDEGKDPFKNVDEAKQWEKIVGKDGLSTEQVRNADKTRLKKWMQEIEEYYSKNPTAVRTQQVTEEYVINDIAITDLDWTDDQYINFLEVYRKSIRPDLAVAILTNLPASKRKDIIGTASDDIEKIRENYLQTPASREKTQPIEEPVTGEEPEPEEEEQTPITEPTPPPTKTPPEETTPEEPPPQITPNIPLTKKEQEKRRTLPLKIYAGPKSNWRVDYGSGNVVNVEARGVVDALRKAHRGKAVKTPSKITVTRETR